MYYNEKPYFSTLKFSDIFPDEDTFEALMTEELTASELLTITPLSDIYRMMYLKYFNSFTRYTVPEPFIYSIIKELKIAWPIYLQQEALVKSMMELEIAEIMKNSKSLRNVVNNPNTLNTNMDETALKNLSTQQESLLNTGNKLQAISFKYEAIQKDYQENLYKYLDPHFRVIISNDCSILYVNEEEV